MTNIINTSFTILCVPYTNKKYIYNKYNDKKFHMIHICNILEQKKKRKKTYGYNY